MSVQYHDQPREDHPLDYPWIIAWAALCPETALLPVSEQLELARSQMAPVTVTAWLPMAKRWLYLEEVGDPTLRAELVDWGSDYGVAIPVRVLRKWLAPAGSARSAARTHRSPAGTRRSSGKT